MAFQSTFPFETSAARADASSLLRLLPAYEGHWDELRDASGALREPWRQFFERLGEDGIARLEDHYASIAQQIRDNDISYNVYADNGEPRPWALDLLPFLISEAEWAHIERGVTQRAHLLNAIVADIYGSQTLLERGQLPPALVFGHPGYLRSVKGFKPPGGQYLQVVAVDLARTPAGSWTVMAHRTEAPSGLGYALENRLIVSTLFAEPFRALHVSRLAPTYSQLIATLAQAAQATMQHDGTGTDTSPHIALLTPGPFSETYFEHVFLARYLGVTLVEGKDLTVRDDMLYLKTLAGLERVHVVLRRLDDAFCDPVELRADSTIGVPGLLQVMRAGNVIVSNVPGSGFVESPALHGFLPGICHDLLNEELVLPGVPTWWCGEE
ncbi:MAG TPA: circularly permuted type 2 ATP-grasp protein, partial [Paraburkholderia sp.]|nr:circularly permuted type 2 ATP-grasp protein [Paraburkholderia sp.]